MPCGACALEMACAGFTNREYERAEKLRKMLSQTVEMLDMAIGYMESVQHDMNGDPPWHHWGDDGDGLEGFRAIHAIALAAATGTAETSATSAQCEASQSGPKGNAQ